MPRRGTRAYSVGVMRMCLVGALYISAGCCWRWRHGVLQIGAERRLRRAAHVVLRSPMVCEWHSMRQLEGAFAVVWLFVVGVRATGSSGAMRRCLTVAMAPRAGGQWCRHARWPRAPRGRHPFLEFPILKLVRSGERS